MGCTTSTVEKIHSEPQQQKPRRTLSKLRMQVGDMDKFLDFCESRYAAENVRFYKALEMYEQMFDDDSSTEDITKAGEQIVLLYLSSKSPNEVTLAHSVKEGIMQVYKDSTWDQDTFRAARSEVVTTLTDPQLISSFEASLVRTSKSNKRPESSRSYASSSSSPGTPSRRRPSNSVVTRSSPRPSFTIVTGEEAKGVFSA